MSLCRNRAAAASFTLHADQVCRSRHQGAKCQLEANWCSNCLAQCKKETWVSVQQQQPLLHSRHVHRLTLHTHTHLCWWCHSAHMSRSEGTCGPLSGSPLWTNLSQHTGNLRLITACHRWTPSHTLAFSASPRLCLLA